jgi:nitroreductase
MEILDAIYHRRSIRTFNETRVEKATIMELLKAAARAPSAINVQPWVFCVIQDKLLLKRYSDRAKRLLAESAGAAKFPGDLQHMLADPEFNIFYNAGTLIVICAKRDGQHPDWDCCFAAQTLMLAAYGMGLGTCPIGFAWPLMEQPDVRKELNIPDGYISVLPIILGYPAGATYPTPRNEPEILCWREPTATPVQNRRQS